MLLKLYPDQTEHLETYRKIFHNLRLMKPEACTTEIVIQYVSEDDTDVSTAIEVYGTDRIAQKEHADCFALEYQPWKEWLGMTVSERTVSGFSEPEIVVHCLYEMTFAGFDEQSVQRKWLKMNK